MSVEEAAAALFTPARAQLAFRAARMLTWIGALAIAVASLVPGSERPHSGLPGQMEHFLAYALVGFCLSFGYSAVRPMIVVGAGLLAAASGLFEILQFYVPGRSPHLLDVLASSAGAGLGAFAGLVALALFARLGERRLAFPRNSH